MKLTYRPTEVRDLAECLHLVHPVPGPPGGGKRLLDAWRELHEKGAFNSAVMEDQERDPGRRLVHFGSSVFVTDAFVREARTHPRPCLNEILLDRFLAGRPGVLDLPAIRRANSGEGLNIFVLHVGMAPDLSPEELQAVSARQPDTFFLAHQGFRLKEILIQISDPQAHTFNEASGFRWRDRSAGLQGLTRTEAEALPGSYAGRIFVYEPPRLGLRPREQQLLQRALLGETDAEIADVLHLAPDTIKARWRSIYGRLNEQAPDLLPQPDLPAPGRGAEKRRHLLHYLRHHPEEMRPF